jgi:hypothetical protein
MCGFSLACNSNDLSNKPRAAERASRERAASEPVSIEFGEVVGSVRRHSAGRVQALRDGPDGVFSPQSARAPKAAGLGVSIEKASTRLAGAGFRALPSILAERAKIEPCAGTSIERKDDGDS